MTPSISAIIITKNEADMIVNCLETLRWCNEALVIDNESSDTTAELAQRAGARVVTAKGSFSDLRNEGLERCKADWILYIDADERVTPELALEIQKTIAQTAASAFYVSRENILYGYQQTHGGWGHDRVVRLFRRGALQKWEGIVHEHAVVEGETKALFHQLIHLTHRNVIDGLLKTSDWTPMEAHMLYESKIPPVTGLTVVRKGVMEVVRRLILKRGWQDGQAGWMESLIQSINRALVYIQVWELQQQPPIAQRYQDMEAKIAADWKKTR